jgi:ribosome-binding protein aMBF1 (putative translation factor)
MATQKKPAVSASALAAARKRAEQTRHQLPSELLTSQELAHAAPFYFVLRGYIQQLKEAREAAGLTLADLSARTGMAVESLSRLEKRRPIRRGRLWDYMLQLSAVGRNSLQRLPSKTNKACRIMAAIFRNLA